MQYVQYYYCYFIYLKWAKLIKLLTRYWILNWLDTKYIWPRTGMENGDLVSLYY